MRPAAGFSTSACFKNHTKNGLCSSPGHTPDAHFCLGKLFDAYRRNIPPADPHTVTSTRLAGRWDLTVNQ